MRKPIAAKTRPLDPAAEQADIPVWKSRIGWRIAVTVFLVTMWLQGARLYDAAQKFEERTLVQHQALARAAIAQHISPNASPPLTRASADRIMATTPVRGLTLYNPDGSALAVYGETAALRWSLDVVTSIRPWASA